MVVAVTGGGDRFIASCCATQSRRAQLVRNEIVKILILLQPALSQLDFIDQFFLDRKILSEDRTPQKLARWLAGADAALKIAVDTRERVEGLAAKFGPRGAHNRLRSRAVVSVDVNCGEP
ncbi:hypothetical protein MTX20_31395 [Bradyrhizobium sp. ISRA435]|nr:hypothetical protein MTX20_31395 [Bradyrhizobium sp. ISRA435]